MGGMMAGRIAARDTLERCVWPIVLVPASSGNLTDELFKSTLKCLPFVEQKRALWLSGRRSFYTKCSFVCNKAYSFYRNKGDNEAFFQAVFLRRAIFLIVSDFSLPPLLELKSKNICINKDYRI